MEKEKPAFIYTFWDLRSNMHSLNSYTASKNDLQGWTAESAVRFTTALLLF